MATTSSFSGPIHQYLDILSTWPTAIAIESQFFVYFNLDTVTALKNLQTDLLNYDAVIGNNGHNWTLPANTIDTLKNKTNQNNSEFMGCVFAKEVTLPNDSIKASNHGLGHFAGFQAPLVSEGRDPYKTIHITFLETNSSFVDFIIRPWVVLSGHYGMIARSTNKIKCDYVDINYIARQGSNIKPLIRKTIRFFGVVPISISGSRSSYATDGISTSTAIFAFDSYCVLDPTKGTSPAKTTTSPMPTFVPNSNLNQKINATPFGLEVPLQTPLEGVLGNNQITGGTR
jgi:hypothetical protein